MKREVKKRQDRIRRHRRVRAKVNGTAERPRLCVYRSLRHICAQLIDDANHRTLLTVSTKHVGCGKEKNGGNVGAAGEVGKLLAEKAREQSITKVVFDRGGRQYHGRIKALADAAREGGLVF